MCKVHNMIDKGGIVSRSLVESLDRLHRVITAAPGAETLQGRATDITATVVDAIIADVAAFSDTANPNIKPLLEQHSAELVAEYLAILDGHSPQLPAFVER